MQNMTYCGYWDVANITDLSNYLNTLNCEADSLMRFTTNETLKAQCECYPPCTEYAYTTDVSYSYWPLDFTQLDFFKVMVLDHPEQDNLKAYNNLHHFNTSDLVQDQLIRKNFVRVNVFLKGMTIEEYIEKKSYELINLFSDIGGSFGLWIGMSFIMWCEVIELVMHLIYHSGRRIWWKYEQRLGGMPKEREKY